MWNFRIVRQEIDGDIRYSIHESFDLPAGEGGGVGISPDPRLVETWHSWTENPIEDLRWTLQRMLDSLDKPILEFESTPKTVEKPEKVG